MLSFRKNYEPIPRILTDRRKDRRTDRHYFIGPFRLRPGVQKSLHYCILQRV